MLSFASFSVCACHPHFSFIQLLRLKTGMVSSRTECKSFESAQCKWYVAKAGMLISCVLRHESAKTSYDNTQHVC